MLKERVRELVYEEGILVFFYYFQMYEEHL